jgi:hypothetical protein
MKIGVDIDDVLASFVPEFRARCQRLHGKPEGDLLPSDWSWSNYDLTPEQIADVWANIGATNNFHLTLKPLKDAYKLNELDMEHELYFISARRPGAGLPPAIQSSLWLEEHFGLYRPTVIIAMNKVPVINALRN